MAYSSPNSSRATSYVVTAANWNELADDIKWLAEQAPTARVYHNTTQSIAVSGTFQALVFNSERWDIGSTHSTVTATSKLTVPSGGGGKYRVGAQAEFDANATGQRDIKICLNGNTSAILCELQVDAAATGDTLLSISGDWALSAGDYIEVYARQTSGGALNVLSSDASNGRSADFWFAWFRS